MDKSKKTILIIFLVIFIVGLVAVAFKQKDLLTKESTTSNISQTSADVSPKLMDLDFNSEISNSSHVVTSNNYSFNISLPKDFEISSDRQFSKYYPDTESVSLYRSNTQGEDLIFSLNIYSKNGSSIDEKADKEIEGAKRSIRLSGSSQSDNDVEKRLNLEKSHVSISGQDAVKMEFYGPQGDENIVYIFDHASKDVYFRMSFYVNNGSKLSVNQAKEVEAIVESFKFTVLQ